ISKEIKLSIVVAAAITVGIVIITLIGLRFAFGSVNPFYVVASGSMIPNLNVGDVVVIRHSNNNSSNSDSSSFNNVKVGDIIVFKSFGINKERQHLTIVHRVARIFTVKDEN